MSIHGAIFQLVCIDGMQPSVKVLNRNTACIIPTNSKLELVTELFSLRSIAHIVSGEKIY
jgi:hypothetical protein